MPTKRKCRSCILAKEFVTEPSKHRLVEADFTCVLCGKKPKWYSHINDELVGDALECKFCHDYIIYINGDVTWKDEIYLYRDDKEVLVMRNYEENTTFVSIDNKEVTTLKHILQFKSVEDLLNKIETIVVFS